MEPILIGLFAILALASHAISLHERAPEVKFEPIAHEPASHVRAYPTRDPWEEIVNEALIARYQRLADEHTRIYLAGGSADSLDVVRMWMRECERELTLRGLATPTCS